MNVTNPMHIPIPMEFRVACQFFKLKPEVALQLFIDHITLFDLHSSIYSKGYWEACQTVKNYLLACPRKCYGAEFSKQNEHEADLALEQVINLAKDAAEEVGIRREKSSPYMNTLYRLTEKSFVKSELLKIGNEATVQLSLDYSVLCEISHCYPKEFLVYFMSKISLADAHARKSLRIINDNFTYMFFYHVAQGLGGNDSLSLELSEEEIEFYLRVDRLTMELYNIRKLEDRTGILRRIYLEHYQSIQLKK